MNIITIGDKFYRKENDKIEIIRIVRRKNEDLFMCNRNGNKERITRKELSDNYIRIKPHGFVSFSILELSEGFDVAVTFSKAEDIDNKDNIPYAVCRQCCINPFSLIVIKDKISYVGVSINKDNCPKDIDFKVFLSCNKIKYNSTISIYIDDNLEDILSLISKVSLYNGILSDIKRKSDSNKFEGFCDTLKSLLEYNDFMFDIHMGFHIAKVDYKLQLRLDLKDNIYSLIPLQIEKLEDLIKRKITKTYVTEYDYSIDLELIQREFILIKDKENKLYVVGYDATDEYVNRSYNKYVPDRQEYLHLKKFIS